MAEQQQQVRSMMDKLKQRSPSSNQLLTAVMVLTGIAVAVVLCFVALAGSGLTLLLATPLFLLFSPVLVPLGIVVSIATGGFVTASGGFLVFCSACSWMYHYVKGKKPVGADKLDTVKERFGNVASQATEKAKEVGAKGQQVAPVA